MESMSLIFKEKQIQTENIMQSSPNIPYRNREIVKKNMFYSLVTSV